MEVQLNDLILKKTHVYYYQVQGQLHITYNRQFCILQIEICRKFLY